MQNAGKREICYTARDEYHVCMDKYTASADGCANMLKKYEEACPGSWRSYFDKQREREKILDLQAAQSRAKVDAARS